MEWRALSRPLRARLPYPPVPCFTELHKARSALFELPRIISLPEVGGRQVRLDRDRSYAYEYTGACFSGSP
jgi:hypothetical protein